MTDALVAPSLLAADFLHLSKEIQNIELAGADWHHIDVMDGHFVSNLTFGPPLIKALKNITKIPLDVHIMVANPEEVADQYIDAGANLLTFHYEASSNPIKLIKNIQNTGTKAGIAINPDTPVKNIASFILSNDLLNFIL